MIAAFGKIAFNSGGVSGGKRCFEQCQALSFHDFDFYVGAAVSDNSGK